MDLSSLSPFGAVTNLVGKVLDRVLPEDKAAKEAANLEVLKLIQTGELAAMVAQTDINKEEAKSTNWWVAGARPFVIWIFGIVILEAFVVAPAWEFWAHLHGSDVMWPKPDTAPLWTLCTAMLGVATQRTIEKINGVQDQH